MRNKKIEYVGVESQQIKDCFEKIFEQYPSLHRHKMVVRQLELKATTMRAQPIIDMHFWSKKNRGYRIDVSTVTRIDPNVKVAEMATDVLEGWFAHELGHVIDYLNRSAWGIIRFGIGYSLFRNYRIGVERMADVYAIDHGFAPQIVATKKFILEHSDLSDKYKRQIEKYYMSPDEIEIMVAGKDADELQEKDAGLF